MRVDFETIAIKATKRWVDENGKRRQQTKEFAQTLNPFNKNPDGSVKSRAEIQREIKAQRDAWMQEKTHD